MAIFEEEQRNLLFGIAIGVGATLFSRHLLPTFKQVGRPLAKATVKSGVIAMEAMRESLARWGEDAEDLFAEVKAELEEESQQKSEGASPSEPADSTAETNGAS